MSLRGQSTNLPCSLSLPYNRSKVFFLMLFKFVITTFSPFSHVVIESVGLVV